MLSKARYLTTLTVILSISTACEETTNSIDASEQTTRADSGTNTGPKPEDDITRIELAPRAVTLLIGSEVPLVVTGFKSDGTTTDLAQSAQWSSSDERVGVVSEAGVLTAVAAGQAIITAEYGMWTATLQLAVSAAQLISLNLTPKDTSTAVGGILKYRLLAALDNGSTADLSAAAKWTSQNSLVASIDTDGLLTGRSAGTVKIMAEFSGEEVSTEITVSDAPLASIRVDPAFAVLAPGSEQEFEATGFLTDGTQANLSAAAEWLSTNQDILQITEGRAKAQQPGEVQLTARINEISGTARVTVTSARLIDVRVEPSNSSLEIGEQAPLRAIGLYENLDEVDLTLTAQWASDEDQIVSVSNLAGQKGLATAISTGTANISAVIGQVSGTGNIQVIAANLESLEFNPSQLMLSIGTVEKIEAFANYSDGNKANVTELVQWTSSNPGVLLVSNTGDDKGTIQALSEGTATLTITLGAISSDLSLTIGASRLVSIEITPSNHVIQRGNTNVSYTAEAVYTDGSRVNITNSALWSVSDPISARISNKTSSAGFLVPRKTADIQVHATYEGLRGDTALSIVRDRIIRTEVQSVNTTMSIGDRSPLTLLAYSTSTTTYRIKEPSSLASSDTGILTVHTSSTGILVEALQTGTVEVSAELLGFTTSTMIEINNAIINSLTIEPSQWTINTGEEYQLTARGIFSDSTVRNVSWSANWTSSNPLISQVGDSTEDKGLLQGGQAGTVQVSAAYDGRVSSVVGNVEPEKITAVSIRPQLAIMSPGNTFQFTAQAQYSTQRTEDITENVSWQSSNPSVAMIGNSGPSDKGEVLALGKGTTTIEAIPLSPMVNPNHPEQTIRLFVTDSPIDRIEIDSPSSLIPVNYGLSLTAKAFFVDGSSLDISHLVAWSSDSILASVSEQGQLEALGIGTVNISIEFMGETDSLPLSISSASLIGIDVSPSMPMILVGEFIEFRATGTFDDGQSRDITEYVTWGSSDPREAWIDNTAEQKGECVGIMPGIVGISASSGTIFGNSQVWIN